MSKDSWYNPSLYPTCNTLLFFLSRRDAYRPTIFSTNEIFCGPDCQNTESHGVVRSIRTPAGVYSIKPIVNTLPQNQKPDILIVKADATARNFPVHLHTLSCPKVLILGNTQHLNRPIRILLEYALQERFDWIITDHKRHHLHYFREAGFKQVHWIPGFNVFPHKHERISGYEHSVCFVGQAAGWHPYRRHVLEYLHKHDVQFDHLLLPQDKASHAYAHSKINLNCSLNGDMNLRVFEVLSSGGFLLTDQLSREAGLEIVFENEKHLCTYRDPSHLKDLIEYYLLNPEQREAIARAGEKRFWEKHSPEKKAAELCRCIFEGDIAPDYDISHDTRATFHTPDVHILHNRIALYEYIQEIHLQRPTAYVAFTAGIPDALICDCHDLPRLHLAIEGMDSERWNRLKTQHPVVVEAGADISLNSADKTVWDLLVITPDMVTPEALSSLLTMYPCLKIALYGQADEAIENTLKTLGLEPVQAEPQLWGWRHYEDLLALLLSAFSAAELLRTIRSRLAGNVSDSHRLHILGLLAFRHHDVTTSEKLIAQALSYAPQDRQLLESTIHHCKDSHTITDAISYAQRLTALYPKESAYWNELGDLSLKVSDYAQARYAFSQSLKQKPDQPQTSAALRKMENKAADCHPQQKPASFRRILVVNNLYPPQELGGYGRLLYDFSTLLSGRGYEVHVLTSDTPYLGKISSEEKNVSRTLELFGEWKNGVTNTYDNETMKRVIEKNLRTLVYLLKEYKPDVCLFGNADFIGADLIGALIGRSIPVLQHLGNPQPGYPPQLSPSNSHYRLAAASRWLRDELWRKSYPLKHIDVIYPGAMVERFYQANPAGLETLQIAYASIVLPYKGSQIRIKALLELKARDIPFNATIAGTSTDMSFVRNLQSICNRAGLSRQVDFAGNLDRDELVSMYKSHNVLVFPSLVSEAFGISQVEAMAAGTCVITSATGGAAEVVEDMQTGLVFSSGDHQSLTSKLLCLHNDRPLWDRLRRQGQKRAQNVFDIQRSVDQIEHIFEQLVTAQKNVS